MSLYPLPWYQPSYTCLSTHYLGTNSPTPVSIPYLDTNPHTPVSLSITLIHTLLKLSLENVNNGQINTFESWALSLYLPIPYLDTYCPTPISPPLPWYQPSYAHTLIGPNFNPHPSAPISLPLTFIMFNLNPHTPITCILMLSSCFSCLPPPIVYPVIIYLYFVG